MYYYTTNEKGGKRIGAVAALLYISMWGLLMFFVTFHFEIPEQNEGILINFGDTESASGAEDLALHENIVSSAAASSAVKSDEQELLTQEHEEAPVIEKKKPKPTPAKVEQSNTNKAVAKPTPTPAKVEEKPQQVNKRALFQGKTAGSTSTSEGNSTGAGNQGNQAGDPTGSHGGTGMGTSGNSFNLSGRNLVGSLPKPDYGANEQGKVVVQIIVDRNGSVTSASFRSAGSTTQNSSLVASAIRAAKKAKFTVTDSDNPQTGSITYIFKMK